jgi:hypothetical protein
MIKILKILYTFWLLPLNIVIGIFRGIYEAFDEFIYDVKKC